MEIKTLFIRDVTLAPHMTEVSNILRVKSLQHNMGLA